MLRKLWNYFFPFLKISSLELQRSPKWDSVRAKFLKKNPYCVVCHTKSKLNVHHIIPFHMSPDLELKESNLITLCESHHFLFGHLNNWQSYNVDCVADCKLWEEKIKNRPN